jgi:hypothetical protein
MYLLYNRSTSTTDLLITVVIVMYLMYITTVISKSVVDVDRLYNKYMTMTTVRSKSVVDVEPL